MLKDRLLAKAFVLIFSCIESAHAGTVLFQDDFAGVPTKMPSGATALYPDRSKWSFTFWPGVEWPTSYGDGTNWLASNYEFQTYVTPFTRPNGATVPNALTYNPFTIKPDGLHITAALLSVAQRSAYQLDSYRKFGSGMLSSYPAFSFLYGKVEVVAKLPSAPGTWPAIWLLPKNESWPPEIDILEGMAWDSHAKQVHSGYFVPSGADYGDWFTVAAKPAGGFHTYGLVWSSTEMTITFDGKTVYAQPTPAGMHTPMYLLINLAIGGKWVLNEMGVAPIDGTGNARFETGGVLIKPGLPADMVIKSVTVAALD